MRGKLETEGEKGEREGRVWAQGRGKMEEETGVEDEISQIIYQQIEEKKHTRNIILITFVNVQKRFTIESRSKKKLVYMTRTRL